MLKEITMGKNGPIENYLVKLQAAFQLLYDKKVSDQDMKYIVTSSFLSKEEALKIFCSKIYRF